MSRLLFAGLLVCGMALGFSFVCSEARGGIDADKLCAEMLASGIKFLRENQTPDGNWSPQMGVGPTAVITHSLLRAGLAPSDETVAKALAFLAKAAQKDGGVYSPGGMYGNYESCLALLCFSAAEKTEKGKYTALLKPLEEFIRKGQFTDENGNMEGVDDGFRGGAGYGKHQRPDLSNTQFFVEALRESACAADDPAIQKALLFVSRCQNLESENNSLPFAAKNPDGGFIYSCADQSSAAGETANGGLRSYASMTYAGLKSMIYAGVDREDRRVKAAFEWITKNYDVRSNPGIDQQGLFYYYQLMSKTLRTLEVTQITLPDGTKRSWRDDLLSTLKEKQNADGSWSNPEPRWMESDPNLVTGYVLLVLADCSEK